MLLAGKIIRDTIAPLTGEDRKNVFIIDGSLFSRNRSKKTELLAKVFDHAHHEYVYGFRMLTLGWSDGNTFLPVSHCLLYTENAKNRQVEASAAIDPRTNGGRQRKLAQQKCTDVAWKVAERGCKDRHSGPARASRHVVLFVSGAHKNQAGNPFGCYSHDEEKLQDALTLSGQDTVCNGNLQAN